jgi:hypothetical protein
MTMDGQTEQQDLASAPASETSQPEVEKKYEKLLEKVRSDSLAELGRVRKAAEDAIRKATESSNSQIAKLIKEQEDRELEAVKGNPDASTAIKERQTRRQRETELTKAQEELNEAKNRLQELSNKDKDTVKERTTREIAERLKIDPVKLADKVKFTDGSAEAIEAIAEMMPKLSPQPRNNFRPDSNEAAGGSIQSVTQIQQDYIKGKINTIQYSDKMKAMGKSP